ncbi:uncharacterized protein LOC131231181 isoform X2 [Magnolia sinica]|uniref:uncharacterized protein LOC131231181 isoform X2 n=1 Tax=Magnolia sinica TaxID=86752 RepID=UPI002658E4A9|nr:uncharacterized protein LOC131231181 isoform X2 [Magnolia sinica]
MGEEISLYLEGLVSPSIPQCRICHEEEGESSKSLEAPCSCSGTLKNFEAGYIIRKKARLADIAVTIRESLEVPRQNHELRHPRLVAIVAAEDEFIETRYPECSSASERSASCCRSLAVIFTILLLARHLVSMLGGADHYPFTLLTVLVLRAGGIIVPLYIMVRTMEAIQRWKRQNQQHHVSDDSSPEEAEEDEQLQHTVQIH